MKVTIENEQIIHKFSGTINVPRALYYETPEEFNERVKALIELFFMNKGIITPTSTAYITNGVGWSVANDSDVLEVYFTVRIKVEAANVSELRYSGLRKSDRILE